MYVYFTNPFAIISGTNKYLSLDCYAVFTEVGPIVVFSDFAQNEINTMSTILLITMIIFIVIYLVIYSCQFLKEGLNLFWAWVDIIQLYNVFLFIDTHLFENVNTLLRRCANFNFRYIDLITSNSIFGPIFTLQENASSNAVLSLPKSFIRETYTSYFL